MKKAKIVIFTTIIFCAVFVVIRTIAIVSSKHFLPQTSNTSKQDQAKDYKILYASVNNATFAYYIKGTGKPLVLLGGFGQNLDKYDPLFMQQIENNHTVIVFDYRGVGRSKGDISNLTQSDMARDTIDLLHILGYNHADFLGWSMGSFLVQDIAEQYPSEVDRLVLVATEPGQKQAVPGDPNIGNFIQNNLGGSWENIYSPAMFYQQDALHAYIQRELAQKTDMPENVDVRIAQEKAFNDTEAEQTRTDNLTSIKAPTLIIAGSKDTIIPLANDRYVHDRIAGSRLEIIPNAGHAVLFEKATKSAELINAFLK